MAYKYVNDERLRESLEFIRDRLVIKDNTEAQALVASASYPNCVYYTSDTNCIVVNGNIYGRGQELPQVFEMVPYNGEIGVAPYNNTSKVYMKVTNEYTADVLTRGTTGNRMGELTIMSTKPGWRVGLIVNYVADLTTSPYYTISGTQDVNNRLETVTVNIGPSFLTSPPSGGGYLTYLSDVIEEIMNLEYDEGLVFDIMNYVADDDSAVFDASGSGYTWIDFTTLTGNNVSMWAYETGYGWRMIGSFPFTFPSTAAEISYDLTNTPTLGTGNVQSAIESLVMEKVSMTNLNNPDYTQLDYIQSNSTACIDTGIAGQSGLEIECEFSYNKFINYGIIWSNHVDADHNSIRCILADTSGNIIVNNNAISGTGGNTTVACSMGYFHTVIVGTSTVNVDGTSTNLNTAQGTENTENIALFDYAYGQSFRDIELRVRRFIIRKNGTELVNFTPCRRNSDNAVGMYDSVSDTFFGSGREDFIAGPDVEFVVNAQDNKCIDVNGRVNALSIMLPSIPDTNHIHYADVQFLLGNYPNVLIDAGNKPLWYDENLRLNKNSRNLLRARYDGNSWNVLCKALDSNDSPYELLYYWDSADELVDNKWVDRVQGAPFTATNPSKADGMWKIGFDGNTNRYFSINLNTYIKLPCRYRIEVEWKVNSITTGNAYAFDFGAVTTANHAFTMCKHITYSVLTLSYKIFGNNSSSLYWGRVSGTDTLPALPASTMMTTYMGVTGYDSKTDIVYVEYNGERVYGKTPHEHTDYNGNWFMNTGYIGRSFTDPANNSKFFGYIKSLKIFAER